LPPRALHPSGIILVDKPAGPTSFAIVAAVRRKTKARTGHAGTLDPFATGLLLLLSGASTGDVDGERGEEHAPPSADELEIALDGLRGAVELPIPAVSAVKVGGERAYALHRRGVAVEMPVRTMHVHELELVDYADGVARLDLHVSSGTYVRAIADALGGHCVSLRRTAIGPFGVDEADPDRIIPPDDALARLA